MPVITRRVQAERNAKIRERFPNGRIYIGIDPGCSGGIAAIWEDHLFFHNLNFTDRHPWDWIADRLLHTVGRNSPDKVAAIEKNTGYVGGNGNPGSAMFKFGRSTGLVTGYIIAAGIPYEEVTPAKWQKALGIPVRDKDKEDKAKFKRRLLNKAQQLYPGEKITLATADAVLIATYCKRKHEGTL